MLSVPDFPDLARLWVFRILEDPQARRMLVSRCGILCDDVGRFLGLEDWIDLPTAEYDQAEATEALKRNHSKIEERAGEIDFPPAIRENFKRFGRILKLDGQAIRIIAFTAYFQCEEVFRDTMNCFSTLDQQTVFRLIARVLRIPAKEVAHVLSPHERLLQSAVIHICKDKYPMVWFPAFTSREIAECLLRETCDHITLVREIVTPAPAPTLAYSDFPHIREHLKLIRPYLRTALREQRPGVNLLFYGSPGTGKSELSRILAREMRSPLFELSSSTASGDPVAPEKRLQSLRMANRLLARRCLMVFDEAEDVFDGGSIVQPGTAHGRKAWINRILEGNAVPTIWIANSINGLDPAYVRRFDFLVQLPVPPKRQRLRTLRRICGQRLQEDTLHRLAENHQLAPAVIHRAMRILSSIPEPHTPKAPDQAVELLVGSTLKAQGVSIPLGPHDSTGREPPFDPALVNGSHNLPNLTASLIRQPAARLCLHGPSGTGKSSFARYLAEETRLPLQSVRSSSILSSSLGATERNLASTFEAARTEGALLLLDEVDSFLQDRRRATRSWEVTAVNEFLTQLESFPGLLVATTNFMDDLDPAALRRFDLKVHFDYLRPEQTAALLRRCCTHLQIGQPDTPTLQALPSLPGLTPGDFATVSRQVHLREIASPADFLEALRHEAAARHGTHKGALGFG